MIKNYFHVGYSSGAGGKFIATIMHYALNEPTKKPTFFKKTLNGEFDATAEPEKKKIFGQIWWNQQLENRYPWRSFLENPFPWEYVAYPSGWLSDVTLYDDLQNISTHFDPKWSGHMYGVWSTDFESYSKGIPFEIPMQGMGLLAFEKSCWKGINQHFKGFGGEEGYIAEKFRTWGGKNICLPQLKWNHRFGRPSGVKYPLILEDRIWNYFIGWLEITKDENNPMVQSIYNYFKDIIPAGSIDNIFTNAKQLMLK
jgi:hypothetical protein